MTQTIAVQVVTPIVESATKKKSPTTKPKTMPAHPSTAVMVVAAITELKEKKGSSLSAVKKYMSTNYKVDSAKLAPLIRKFLKASVLKGSLVQTNGNGAMGHFKLPLDVKKKHVVVKKPSAIAVKVAVPKKPTKVLSAGAPIKRKLVAKASTAAKKPKTVSAKPKKSLIKAKKTIVVPKPPIVKTTAVKQIKALKKK